jgi:hypothetical protein
MGDEDIRAILEMVIILLLVTLLVSWTLAITKCCDDQRVSQIIEPTDGPLTRDAERQALGK